jgi:membrane-associated phospholipid phosphatase
MDGARRPDEHPLLGMPGRDVITSTGLAIATATLFVIIAVPSTRAGIQRLDDAFLRRMLDVRSSGLTALAIVLNVLGLVYVTLPVRLVVAGYLALKRRWWHLLTFVSAILVSEVLIGTLKALYGRARPPHPLVHVSGGSFPSGHAVAASVTTVALVIALFPEGPRRYLWGALAGLFSLVMALSRADLAAHWLSDAVGGTLLGTTVALVAAGTIHFIREHRALDGGVSSDRPRPRCTAPGRRPPRRSAPGRLAPGTRPPGIEIPPRSG